MDKCKRCGKSLGILSGLFADYCGPCKEIIEQEKKSEQVRLEREKSTKQQRQFEEFSKYRTNLARNKIQIVRNRIENGDILFFYRSVYLSVDSIVVEETVTPEFSIAELVPLGLDGWNIVGIVPKTLGVGLRNSLVVDSGTRSWGAGIGGNIVGVYVLLRREISSTHRVPDDLLEEYITENISEFVTQFERQSLLDILSGTIRVSPELEADENTIEHDSVVAEQKNDSERVCPECGIPMSIKIANSGEKRGQSFYVCPNYKQCKQIYPVED